MPTTDGYRPTVAQLLIKYFKTYLGSDVKFRSYYEGDPIILPEQSMPALIISEPRTQYDLGPTGHDQITHTMTIQVVFNKKDELGKPDDAATLENTIDNVVQGRDETTGDFKAHTVMAVLRKNYSLGNLVIESVPSIEKGIVRRSETLTTVEAHITVIISELQAVSSRA